VIRFNTFIEPGRLQMTEGCMRISCWVPKATNTHTQVCNNFVFPVQHWMYERASVLRYTYIVCLVLYK
jgi:hypothetical protein